LAALAAQWRRRQRQHGGGSVTAAAASLAAAAAWWTGVTIRRNKYITHQSYLKMYHKIMQKLKLYTESVFFGRYWSVFLGIYHTDTDGKLGRYISVSKREQLPPFFLKRGAMAPFLMSSAPFEEKRGEPCKKGGNDSDRNTKSPANLIPAKYRYRKNCW
jgi:hypothetical protein